jgi:electron transport complex protein RnfG
MLIAMVGIGVICALLIVVTYEGTGPRIEKLQTEALHQAIFKVVPDVTHVQAFELSGGSFTKNTDGDRSKTLIYAGYSDAGELAGFAIEASGQGYADIIRILYGYDPVGKEVTGFYVLESKETPGLGDKIEKDPVFLENFKHLDVALKAEGNGLAHEVVTVKSGSKQNPWEIDGITGATISSRAIGDIINTSAGQLLPVIHKNIDVFNLEQPGNGN